MTSASPPPPPDTAQRSGAVDHPINVVVHPPPPSGPRSRLPTLLRAFQFTAVVTLLSVAISGASLWYESAYVPTTLPAGITVTATLKELQRGPAAFGFGDITAFEGEIHVENPGTRRVTVLSAQYTLWGISLVPRTDSSDPTRMLEEQALCSQALGSRYVEVAPGQPTVLSTGRFIDGSWFDAGQDHVERPLFFVRKADFDAVQLSVSVAVAKGDLVTQVDNEPIPWDSTELADRTAGGCLAEVEGDLSATPLYWTDWALRSRTPVLGAVFPDNRRISVEWRLARWVGRGLDGSACSLYQEIDLGGDLCFPEMNIGESATDAWVEPLVAYCRSSAVPESCDLIATMSLSDRLKLEQDLGLASSGASTTVVLWPDVPSTASP